MQYSQINNLSSIFISLIFIIGLLFSVPLFAILIVVFYFVYIHGKYYDASYRYGVYCLLAFSLSYINLSKPLMVSDLRYYYWLYNFAGDKSFADYFSLIPKEPIYHCYNYIMRYCTLGNFNLFLIVNTIIIYVLIMVSYDKLCQKFKINTLNALYAAIFLLLFPEFFFYTAQIIRQVLAGAVAFYGITKLICDKSKFSLIIICSVGFIHASAFIFLFVLLLYFLRKMNLSYQLILTVICMVGYGFFLQFLGVAFSDISTIDIAIGRGLSNSTESVSIGILPLVICGMVLPLSLFLIWNHVETEFRTFFMMPIALVLFIGANINKPLFVLRFMEYIYMYIPIVFMLVLSMFKFNKLLLSLVILLCIRFALKLSSSDFQFMSISDFMSSGIVKYLLIIFNNEHRLY